jgi:hypothetical protein
MFIVGNYTMRPKRLPSQYNEGPNLSDKREAAFIQGAAADSQLSGLGTELHRFLRLWLICVFKLRHKREMSVCSACCTPPAMNCDSIVICRERRPRQLHKPSERPNHSRCGMVCSQFHAATLTTTRLNRTRLLSSRNFSCNAFVRPLSLYSWTYIFGPSYGPGQLSIDRNAGMIFRAVQRPESPWRLKRAV